VDRHDFTLSPTTTSEYQQLEQPWAICGQPSVEMSRPLVWSWSGGLKSWDWALGSGLYDPELGKRRSSNALSSGRSMKRKAKRTHKTMYFSVIWAFTFTFPQNFSKFQESQSGTCLKLHWISSECIDQVGNSPSCHWWSAGRDYPARSYRVPDLDPCFLSI